ncbi:MAG: dipeptidase PepV [Clostridia bacterium]|nr:dipeptidase PepV [Clostridia bacterium]
MLDKFIENSKGKIVKKVQELIQIPSVYENSDNPSKPFGENANKALEYMLELGNSLGFRTKNIDGYCGYIEFGEGEELIGIIGHLDVVPEGEGWTYPPFSGTIFDNKIYGRGAIDDKGPVIASLYAMKAVMDNCKIHKRVRLILGLNEENDWKCINYYKKHEELPTIGFSPDADFPCIYAEKSILTSYISMDYSIHLNDIIKIKEIDCNNNAINVVPKFCSTILEINNSKILTQDFINFTKRTIDKYNFEIDIYKINEQQIKLTSHGIQAHAAHPDLGKNAISQLMAVLHEIFKNYNINIELFEFFYNYIGTQYNGKNLRINFEDESGKLTLNIGKLDLINSTLEFGMNLRIPINTSLDTINNIFINHCKSYPNLNYNDKRFQPSLFIPKDNYLVKTLCNIFNETTGSNSEPIAIGGATYARAFNNCISFGANFPGNKDMCHQTDEFIDINNLILASKIYAKAIYEIGTKGHR